MLARASARRARLPASLPLAAAAWRPQPRPCCRPRPLSQAATPPRPAVDVVWMHNGWEMIVPMMQRRLDEIETHACTVRQASYSEEGELQLESLAGAHVLVPAMAFVTEERLAAAGDGLALVYQPAVDTSRIDVEACRARGIPVCHAPGSNANALAEAIVMLMLAVARGLPEGIARTAAPPEGWGGPAGTELRGRTLGIIGVTGHSGQLLRQICEAGFGMRVLGTTSTSTDAEVATLLAESDFISVNCVLNDATRGLLGTREFARMKKGAVLINCARAGIVDRDALAAALDSGQLGAAALDVHWEEPCQPGDSIVSRPNVIATPHLGASTQQFFDNISELCLRNTRAVLEESPADLLHRLC